jgi:Spy/CpxP family protein refolding chaperone
MKKIVLAFVVLAAFASVMLIAQTTANPPTPPSAAERAQHHLQFLTTTLSLNTQQQQQATTIFTNANTAEDAVRANMKSAHEALHNAMKANDPAAIDQASANIGNLTAQTTAIHAKAMAAFYQILNGEQQAKLEQLHQHGPGMGHGMMMGPMGPPHMD